MKLKIHRDTADYIILLLIFLQLVILDFFGLSTLLSKMISAIIMARLLLQSDGKGKQIVLLFLLLVGIYVLSTLASPKLNWNFAKSNLLMQTYPLIYAYYVGFLCTHKSAMIQTILDKYGLLFNSIMIANIIVIFYQIFVPYSIMAVSEGNTVNAMYEDTISGLFQYNGVHLVCLYTIFVVLYNLGYRKKINKPGRRALMALYLVFLCAISVFIGTENDNKALFFLLPFALLIYWMTDSAHFSKKKMAMKIILLICISIVLGIGYISIADIQQFIDDNILSTIGIIARSRNIGNAANGSNERIAMIIYALKIPSTWMVGKGFGNVHMYTSGYLGFNHFGQADLGTLMILGGIWYVTILLSAYYTIFGMILNVHNREEVGVRVGFMLLLLFLMIYTQIFSRTDTMICVLLIALAFRFTRKEHVSTRV